MNYYEVLRIAKNATQEQIRKAFRVLVMQYHPDKNPSPHAEQQFLLIKKAYDTLSDTEKREQYDRLLEQPANFSVDEPEKDFDVKPPFQKQYKAPPNKKEQQKVVLYFVVGLVLFSITVLTLGYYMSLSISHGLYQEGLEAEQKFDFELAEKKYAEALDFYYRDTECLLRLALVEVKLGKHALALEHFTEVIALQKDKPLSQEYMLLHCELLVKNKRYYPQAQTCLDKLTGQSPRKRFLQALIFIHGRGWVDEGIKRLKELTQYQEVDFEAWMEIANYFNAVGEPLESNEAALQARKIRPNEGVVYFIFGKNALLLSDTPQACEHFRLSFERGYHQAKSYLRMYDCAQ